jgi:hypothetical protein
MKTEDRASSDTITILANTLLPLSRVLMERDLGAGPLVLAVKLACLRAAIETVPRRGTRVNVSRLAVATGMTRKEIALLLKNTESAAESVFPRIPLEQRALRVIRGWTSDPRFKTRDGRPAQLSLRGGAFDFSSLVRTYGGDVTSASVLKELERTDVVVRSKQGKVRLRRVARGFGSQSCESLEEFADLLKDFVDTTSQVISQSRGPTFFGFHDSRVNDQGQAALFQRTFARRAAALLASVQQWQARQQQSSKKDSRTTQGPTTRVGLGVYLVRSDSQASVPPGRQERRPRS